MYCISEEQIDYILNDISARGVEMEGLQLNLLDHICCIIEQQLEDNGDFEQCYSRVIQQFYKNDLREIEEETISLLTNKNYYVMKKIMLYSGGFSATMLSFGILFKYMHSPGASVLIVSGILTLCLVFIPLLFTLKVKEKQNPKDKLLVALGTLSAITIAMAILLKIMHWPGANVLGLISPAILAFAFLPLYFITGYRNPETKVNTIVTSILIIAGLGLFFSLTITPQTGKLIDIRNTRTYLTNEQILKTESDFLARAGKIDTNNAITADLGKKIYAYCDELKAYLIESETGNKAISPDFESKNAFIKDFPAQDLLTRDETVYNKLQELGKMVAQYNAVATTCTNHKLQPIQAQENVIDMNGVKSQYRVVGALNDFVQIQMLVLQNERTLASL